MRIIFMGSAGLSCPSLAALLQSRPDELAGVVCQPDRPQGRELHVAPCAVKKEAQGAGVPILTPANVNAPDSVSALRALRPDLIVVVAYGQILRAALLEMPPCGCLNIHASLLPRYRGAAPIQWAIANGEQVTGVTAMMMTAALDAGDILLQREAAIDPEDTGLTLHETLGAAGAAVLLETIEGLRNGSVPRRPQNPADATYAPKLTKADGKIAWTLSGRQIHNRVRGFKPWPGCYCTVSGGQALKLLHTRLEAGDGRPGQVLDLRGDGPLVAAGDAAVRLLQVQPEGKRPMSGADYARGHALRIGDALP